jgi:hypothetical protein
MVPFGIGGLCSSGYLAVAFVFFVYRFSSSKLETINLMPSHLSSAKVESHQMPGCFYCIVDSIGGINIFFITHNNGTP